MSRHILSPSLGFVSVNGEGLRPIRVIDLTIGCVHNPVIRLPWKHHLLLEVLRTALTFEPAVVDSSDTHGFGSFRADVETFLAAADDLGLAEAHVIDCFMNVWVNSRRSLQSCLDPSYDSRYIAELLDLVGPNLPEPERPSESSRCGETCQQSLHLLRAAESLITCALGVVGYTYTSSRWFDDACELASYNVELSSGVGSLGGPVSLDDVVRLYREQGPPSYLQF